MIENPSMGSYASSAIFQILNFFTKMPLYQIAILYIIYSCYVYDNEKKPSADDSDDQKGVEMLKFNDPVPKLDIPQEVVNEEPIVEKKRTRFGFCSKVKKEESESTGMGPQSEQEGPTKGKSRVLGLFCKRGKKEDNMSSPAGIENDAPPSYNSLYPQLPPSTQLPPSYQHPYYQPMQQHQQPMPMQQQQQQPMHPHHQQPMYPQGGIYPYPTGNGFMH